MSLLLLFRGTANSPSFADSLTLSESLSRTVTFPRSASDTITLSESLARTEAEPRPLNDAITLSESLTRTAQAFTRGLSDAVHLADSLTRTTALLETFTDSITLTDAVTRTLTLPRSLTDTVTLAENLFKGAVRPLADSMHLTESLTRAAQASGRSLTDTMTLSDVVVRMTGDPRVLSDQIQLGDSTRRGTARSLTDAIRLADTAQRIIPPVSLADSMTLTEALTVQFVAAVSTTQLPAGFIARGTGRVAVARSGRLPRP